MLFLIQLLPIIIVIIYENNNPKSMYFWSALTFIIPMGILIYVLFGNSLKFKTRKIIKSKYKTTKQYLNQTSWITHYKNKTTNPVKNFKKRALYCGHFDVWHYGNLKIFSFGNNFVNALLKDIKKAQKYIFLQFYIFSDDNVGNKIKDALIKKAKSGVEIRVLYDDFGSFNTNNSFWQQLKENNIKTTSFFPSHYKFFNSKVNYRNHRKLVIIDGKVAYVGGLNIRDDHMGNGKISPWRDAMARVGGGVVFAILNIFLNDYLSQNNDYAIKNTSKFFSKITDVGTKTCQVITSGPDGDKKYIYKTYLKAITMAKRRIIIQTPYFVIDKKMIRRLRLAAKRGVRVDIIIPKLPDKNIIYSASLRCVSHLVGKNVNIYAYNGFIHSKVFVVDNNASIGSCNFDNRSFKINFEDTLILYSKSDLKKVQEIVKQDKANSILLTKKSLQGLKKQYHINWFVFVLLKNLI
ncbi:MAG: cardiolipin synthase [Clostridia bacterium]|nr:cardiolipin synthase [Clostridia bacterium]